jgi:predicted nicotinamide N-methyase
MLAPHLSHLQAPPPPQLGDQPADSDLTWAYPWPAGLRFSAVLARFADCRARRIADLGCGRGNLGLTALLASAAQVVFADRSATALAFVEAVLGANGLAARGLIARHEWGTPIPGAPFDLILGGDILYRPAFFPHLLASIAHSLASDGHALLADPRQRLDAELPDLAAAAGVTWDIIHQEPGWGTVVKVQRRP